MESITIIYNAGDSYNTINIDKICYLHFLINEGTNLDLKLRVDFGDKFLNFSFEKIKYAVESAKNLSGKEIFDDLAYRKSLEKIFDYFKRKNSEHLNEEEINYIEKCIEKQDEEEDKKEEISEEKVQEEIRGKFEDLMMGESFSSY